MRNLEETERSGVYVIDYRGPETHSYIPPPDRGHRHHRSKVHRAGNIARPNV